MKQTDKRFWKFEAMMLLCGFLLFDELLLASLCKMSGEFNMFMVAVLIVVLLYFAICGIPTWLLYKGNSWLKLAGWLYLISSLLVIVPLLIFFYDWNPITANMRPADISPDEGKYITDNELVAIVCAMWAVFLTVPVLITSFLTKRWIVNVKKPYKKILDSARRAVKGNIPSNARAIAMSYTNNQLILKCYLDSLPTEQDEEILSDISGEIVSDFPSDEIPEVKEECIFSEQPLSELDCLDNWINDYPHLTEKKVSKPFHVLIYNSYLCNVNSKR